jgi:hypothetical protein
MPRASRKESVEKEGVAGQELEPLKDGARSRRGERRMSVGSGSATTSGRLRSLGEGLQLLGADVSVDVGELVGDRARIGAHERRHGDALVRHAPPKDAGRRPRLEQRPSLTPKPRRQRGQVVRPSLPREEGHPKLVARRLVGHPESRWTEYRHRDRPRRERLERDGPSKTDET